MPDCKLKLHPNGKWYVHWADGRRTMRRSCRTSDAAAAKEFLHAWCMATGHDDSERGLMPGRRQALKRHRATCAELWEVYYDEHLRPKTHSYARTRAGWKNLQEAFGDWRPSEVTQAALYEYEDARVTGRIGRPAQRSTVWLEVNMLATSWNYGIRTGRLRPNERGKVIFPAPSEPRDRWLRDEEVERFLTSLVGLREFEGRMSRVERFSWIALETGARKRVVETLTWNQVDLEARVIHFRRSHDHRTLKRRPSVPISDTLLPVLEQAYAERRGAFVLDHTAKISWEFEAAAARALIDGLTPHVLRHTAATWMARRGVSFWQIAGVLGNTVGMVEKVYAKHCPVGLAEAVSKIIGGSRREISWKP